MTCAFDVLLHGLKKDHLWNSFIVLAHVLVVFWSELQQVGIWSLAESVAESVESISQNLKSLHAWQIEQQALYVVSLLISLQVCVGGKLLRRPVALTYHMVKRWRRGCDRGEPSRKRVPHARP